jgi:hypothetical protein
MYHAHVKNFSRANGESSIAAAAYRAGLDLVDTHSRVTHRYSQRQGVVMHRMLAPQGAPAWCLDPEVFWDMNEAGETRHNARIARELEVSLPHELSADQREKLALDLGQMLVDRYHCVVLVAVHLPSQRGDHRNHHVHLLMSARQVSPIGLGDRAGSELDARKGAGHAELRSLRAVVADMVNAALTHANIPKEVDHRSLATQARIAADVGDLAKALGLNRKPTVHRGKIDTAIMRKRASEEERRGEVSALIAQAQAEGRLMETPDRHTLDAARRERGVIAPPEKTLSGPQHLMDQRQFKAWFQWEMSPIAVRLDRQFARVRAEGGAEEVLRVEAQLINDWLEAQREAATEMLRSVQMASPGGQVNPGFSAAVEAVKVDRSAFHAATPDFFAKSEWLCRKVVDYARLERDRLAVGQNAEAAWAHLLTAKLEHPHPRSSARLNAQRIYNIAREQQTGKSEERRRAEIADAFNEMQLALTMVETDFPMPRTNIFGQAPAEQKVFGPFEDGEGAGTDKKSDSNKRELKPRPPRSGMSGSMGMRH